MVCLICGLEIRQNDCILLVTEAVYDGPCDDDVTYQFGPHRVDGTIHLECLKSPADAARTPNLGVPGLVDKELVVRRSNALSLFE